MVNELDRVDSSVSIHANKNAPEGDVGKSIPDVDPYASIWIGDLTLFIDVDSLQAWIDLFTKLQKQGKQERWQ